MKTFMAKKEEADRKWYVIDAENKILGKVAVKAANILRGKSKPEFTPHMDNGDFVVVLNASKVRLSGKKEEEKKYQSYSGYPGGQKEKDFKMVQERKPELIILNAVAGMIPKNRLGRQIIKKLKVYQGPEHPHKAQSPKVIEL